LLQHTYKSEKSVGIHSIIQHAEYLRVFIIILMSNDISYDFVTVAGKHLIPLCSMMSKSSAEL